MLSSVTLYCQVTMIVIFWCSQLSEMSTISQLLLNYHLEVLSKCLCLCLCHCLYRCLCICLCLFVVQIMFSHHLRKCLKDHKSQSSLFGGVFSMYLSLSLFLRLSSCLCLCVGVITKLSNLPELCDAGKHLQLLQCFFWFIWWVPAHNFVQKSALR